ncbi:GrpB family protein [Deinococcus misasensis]|uniref:GrpB family protein n=1 Tax=Deinococcus misasensis TaxID=392413 RepID=UPI0006911568|nr:GrpB family protein [Deinococcus misasensis]
MGDSQCLKRVKWTVQLSDALGMLYNQSMPSSRKNSPVEIVEYDPEWHNEYQHLAQQLHQVLQGLVLSIEHVGSTSVVGLAAKPVVDIDVILSSRLKLPEVIRRLTALGYVHVGNQQVPGREVFKQERVKKHHLYVCSVDTPNLHNHLIFRDYLRAHPEEAQAYGALKKQLASVLGHDREAYSLGKTEFVQRILALAEEEYGFARFQPTQDSSPTR